MAEEEIAADVHARAAGLLRRSRRAVALTGAGISTPSGIADFRSPETGIWNKVDPEEVASIGSFLRDPAPFYDWFGGTAETMFRAEPNPAHHALAELERRGILRAVVTQNIDSLHQKAGSRRVVELHGNTRSGTCQGCGETHEAQPLLEKYVRDHRVPRCRCGGVIKPDVVLYGEMLPYDALLAAEEEIASCDLLLVVGSSLTVAPAAQLPLLAIRVRTPLVVCNIGPTWADPYAAAVLREDVAQSLPSLLSRL